MRRPARARGAVAAAVRDVILELVTRYGQIDDVARQPFATNFLTLHSESSARHVDRQPRYIVLMCCEPGDATTAAQTVVPTPRHPS